jgi:hypothetical protein
MNRHDEVPYILPPELLEDAKEADARLRKSIEYVDHGMLLHRRVLVPQFKTADGDQINLYGADLLAFLQPVVSSRTTDSATQQGQPQPQSLSFVAASGQKILSFIRTYFYQLREIICKRLKKNFPLSHHTTVAIVGVTHWLLQHFGVDDELAKSTASAIVVALVAATKGTFCKMTAKEAEAFWLKFEAGT